MAANLGIKARAAGRAWQGSGPLRRQSLRAPASHIKPPRNAEVLKASAPPFIRLTNNT